MEYKYCSRCERTKSISDFNTKNGKPVTYCRFCKSIMDKQSYQRHKEKRLKQGSEYRRKLKESYKEKVGSQVCRQCNELKDFSSYKPDYRAASGYKSVCEDCKRENIKKSSEARRKTTSEFIEEAIAKHGSRYDYSLVDYKTASTKIKIICGTHGIFEQTPFSHLHSNGCVKCGDAIAGAKRSSKDFVERAAKVHDSRYDYSLVTYTRCDRKVDIICKSHGVFKQTPHSHLKGQGCPFCHEKGGYKLNKPGILYVFKSDSLVKIGITNKNPNKRRLAIQRATKLNFQTHRLYENCNGITVANLEKHLLSSLRKTHKQPEEPFGGHTECFYDLDVGHVDALIDKFLLECLDGID